MRRRRVVGAGVGGFVAVLLAASGSWACGETVIAPRLAAPEPARATSGSVVVLRGTNWSTLAPVEARWATEKGPVLGTVEADRSGTFALSVVIPSAPPGAYLVVAMQGAKRDVHSFEVPAPLTPLNDASGESGVDGATPNPARVTSNRTSGAPRGSTAGATPAAGLASSSPAAAPLAGSAEPGAAQLAEPGREPLATPSTAGSSAITAPTAADNALPSAARLVSGDLWSGFAAGDGKVLRGPSLVDGVSAASPGPSGAAMVVGLFTSGLVALFGGFAVAEVRRRRVLATVPQMAKTGSGVRPER